MAYSTKPALIEKDFGLTNQTKTSDKAPKKPAKKPKTTKKKKTPAKKPIQWKQKN